MRKLRIIAVMTMVICISKLCGAEEIHDDWIKLDSVFINQVKKLYKSNPLSIESHLEPWENSRVNLGFGYTLIQHSIGKGYVSIFYTFIYKDKKLVSYILKPQMPNESRLTKRYLSFYEGLFEIKNSQPQDLYCGYKYVTKPRGNIDNVLNVSSQIEYFMTPYSGVVYGDSGGIANEILDNRTAFNEVKESITEDVLIYILKSVNPATRLCAAELFNSKYETFEQKDLIENLIEMNFKELPQIETMSGCVQHIDDARKVLNQMLDK